MYQDTEPVMLYLDPSNIVVIYEFFDTTTQTGIIAQYFNIDIRKINGRVFDYPK